MGVGYRREWLVIGLIALSTLVVINPRNTQDVTRLALSLSITQRGSLDIDPYAGRTTDRAFYDGHWYTDKAPGQSLLAIPTLEVLRGFDAATGDPQRLAVWNRVGHIWLIRLLTSGIGLLVAALLVGRAAEGLRAGYGAPVAITFALGTIAGPLGPTSFEHDAAAAFAFAAFFVAARGPRLALAAGALAGAAVLCEYQTALIAPVLALYVALRFGRRSLLAFCLGGVPAAIGLGAYNWAAFGSPFHLSYKYVANIYTERQHEGFFGIGTPTSHGAWFLFLDGRGLLIVSPVLVAAAAGLVLLWRRGVRAEAAVCLAVTLIFLFADMGYFDPYGGVSPGPRFFVPALPFIALGLVESYRRWPVVTSLLALWSIAITTFDGITWANLNKLELRWDPNTIWARMPVITTHGGLYFICVTVALTVAWGALELVRARRGTALSLPGHGRSRRFGGG